MSEFDLFKDMDKIPVGESSLSRLYKHNTEHDCGVITAFRVARNCGEGTKYTVRENRQRDKSLRARLMSLGYGVTSIRGKGDQMEPGTTERGYFVVDGKDTGTLLPDLQKLGGYFEQDAILMIPQGSFQGDAAAFVIGTNGCSNNFLKGGLRKEFSSTNFGSNPENFATYVHGRPFVFEFIIREYIQPASNMGVWAMHLLAKEEWFDLPIDEVS